MWILLMNKNISEIKSQTPTKRVKKAKTILPHALNPFSNPRLMVEKLSDREAKRLFKIDEAARAEERRVLRALKHPKSSYFSGNEFDPAKHLITVDDDDIEVYMAATWQAEPGSRMYRVYYNYYGVYDRVQSAKKMGQWPEIVARAAWVREHHGWRHGRVSGVYVQPRQFGLMAA